MENKVLEELGLTKNECKVYLALIDLNKSKITQITRMCGLHAKNVYGALDSLMEKGLVSFILEGQVRVFSAESPMKLREILLERSKNLDFILPQLLESFRGPGEVREVSLLKGKEGLKAVLSTLAESVKSNPSEDILVYAPHDISLLADQSNINYFRSLFSIIKRSRGHLRAIHIKSRKSKENAALLDKGYSKFISRKFCSHIRKTNVAWTTVGNVLFINFFVEKDMLYIRIKSDDIATCFRDCFEILWRAV